MADAKDTLFITNIPRGWEESDLLKILTEVGPVCAPSILILYFLPFFPSFILIVNISHQEAPRKLRYSMSKATAYASYTDHDTALRCLKVSPINTLVNISDLISFVEHPKASLWKSCPSVLCLPCSSALL